MSITLKAACWNDMYNVPSVIAYTIEENEEAEDLDDQYIVLETHYWKDSSPDGDADFCATIQQGLDIVKSSIDHYGAELLCSNDLSHEALMQDIEEHEFLVGCQQLLCSSSQ